VKTGRFGEQPAPDDALSDDASLASIYRERAAALARPAPGAVRAAPGEKVVLFDLGVEVYGLPIRSVERIFARPSRVPAPGVGRRWAGVFAVQGEIVPILDLARVLDLPEAEAGSEECVLTLRAAGRRVGVLAGRAREIRELPMEALRQAGDQARYLKGVGPDNELILDVDLLAKQEFSQ
jgi:chemotaxis signal transduction protein